MPRTHPPYPPEFKRQMLELVRAGRTHHELSREFGRSPHRQPRRLRPRTSRRRQAMVRWG